MCRYLVHYISLFDFVRPQNSCNGENGVSTFSLFFFLLERTIQNILMTLQVGSLVRDRCPFGYLSVKIVDALSNSFWYYQHGVSLVEFNEIGWAWSNLNYRCTQT